MKNARWISLLLAMLLCLCVLPVHAETVEVVETITITSEADLPENDELFTMYAERQFYGGGEIAFFGRAARDTLTEKQQLLYDDMKVQIQAIAAGQQTSSIISVDFSDYPEPFVYTHSEEWPASKQFGAEIGAVLDALLADCPFDLFWYDKLSGTESSMSMSIVGDQRTVESVTANMTVAQKYAAGDLYTLNTLPQKVATAVAEARKIVTDNQNKSDLEKMTAYKEAICGLVTYDEYAAKQPDEYFSTEIDPWQLISVFDGDPGTNVVCEGYSKAFQYLCDLSTFTDAESYLVTGYMDGGTGAGGHMWNVVKLNGKNYLVDVTNSDADTVGQDGSLFFAKGYEYADEGFIYVASGKDILYTYDEDLIWDYEITEPGPAEASITAPPSENYRVTYYMSIDDAFPKWVNESGLYLESDVTVDGNFSIPTGTLTLFLNGKTWTPASSDPMITVSGDAWLHINDTDFSNNLNGTSASRMVFCFEGGVIEMDDTVAPDNWLIMNEKADATVGQRGNNMIYHLTLPQGYFAYDANGLKVDTMNKGQTYTIAQERPLISITPATITVDPSVDPKYNGTSWEPGVTVTLNGITLKKDTDYTIEYSNNVNAGKATITVTGIGNYTDTATGNFTIALGDPSDNITVPVKIPGLVYTGSPQELVTAGETTAGIMEYSLDGNTWSTAIPTATDAGSYIVHYHVKADNYEEVFATVVGARIDKATPVVTAPTAKTGLTYTGSAQELVAAGETTGGTLEYSLDGTTWSADIPTGTDAGDYTVSYRVTGNNNYKDVAEASLDAISIAQAKANVTAPTAKTGLTYTGSAQELVEAGQTDLGTLEYSTDGGANWSATVPTATNAGNYTVSYRVLGNENLIGKDKTDIAVSIAKAAASDFTATANTLTYNGEAQALVTADAASTGILQYSLNGTTWSADIPTAKDAGTYTVYYKVPESANVSGTETQSVEATISPIAFTLELEDGTYYQKVYDGTTNLSGITYLLTIDMVGGSYVEGEASQALLDHTAYFPGSDVGTYDVTLTFSLVGDAAKNYTITNPTLNTVAAILPKPVTVTGLTAIDRAYNGKTDVGLTGGVVEGVVAGETVAVDLSAATATMADANVGTAKAVTVTGVALSGTTAANYELTAQPTGVTVNITPAELTLTAATIRDQLFTDEGNYTLEVTSATFAGLVDGETLTAGTDYTATAEMTGPNVVDTEAAATVTVTLTNPNYTLAANTVASTVKLVTHSHAWAFSGSGDTITATCSGTIGTCPAGGTATIQLVAPADLTYNGTAKEATVTQSPVNTFADLPPITYSGNATDAGDYTATLTYQGATATVNFTIAKADLTAAAVTLDPATFTYDGNAKEPAATVKLGETTLTAGTDYTITYADNTNAGTATVTVTGAGNYAGAASQTFSIEKAALTAADFTFTAPADLVYDGNAKAATVTTAKTGVGEITISYAKSGAAADPIDAGSYTVAIDVAEGDNYQAATGLTSADWAFAITAAGTDVTAQADKAEYTYGETVTVTASRAAKPVTFALRLAPAADQMALFLGDTQVSDPVDAVGGTYTMTIDTSLKELAIGDNTLTVKYVSNGNLSDATATVTVKLVEKELTIIDATATSRVFKTDDKEVAVTAVTLSGIVGTDDVAANLTDVKGTLTSDAAGTYTSLTLPALELTGADAGYYRLTVGDTTPTNVEIQKILLTNVTAPSGVTLPSYVETAEAVAQQLPATIGYSNTDGAGLDLPATWTCDSYDATPGKTNTFTWTVDASSNPNYAIDAGVATTGTAIVTNADALAVTHTGTDATITFADQPYNVAAMFTVDTNAGAAQYAITGGTGEGTLSGTQLTITKVGTFTIGLTTEAKGAYGAGSAEATLKVNKGVPAVTAPTGLTATYGQTLNDVTLPTAADGAWAWVEVGTTAVGDAGQQTHQVTYTPNDTTNWKTVTLDATITVGKQASNVTDMTSYLDTTETTTFTYGEVITVKVKVQQVKTFALRMRAFTPPAKDQMALFIGDRQISEPAYAENGVFTMTVDTSDKDLKVGSNEIVAKYVGNDNVAPAEMKIDLQLNRKKLTVNSIEAQDRQYQPGNDQVVITDADMSGILVGDKVTAAGATATVKSANAANYSEAALPQDLALSGEDAEYYEAEVDVTVSVPVTSTVTILPADPEPSSETQGQPAVTPVTQPGKTLADVPLTLPAGSYNVPGTIQWLSDPTTAVVRGQAYEWVFIPDDPNYARVFGSSIIYPAGDAPVVTAPTETQSATVPENGGITLTMNAKGATTYQWYVNRNDGNGYLPIEGAASASYNTGALQLTDNGNTYYCKVTNQYGEAITPIYIVNVIEQVEVPKTGDQAQLGLWYALMAISMLALVAVFAKQKRVKG